MGLIWLPVVIAGCVALALCIVAALLRPMTAERRRLRVLANTRRLTMLPEYRRAVRSRTRAVVVTIVLLAVMFGGAIIVAARPTGLSTAATRYAAADPEDVMLCVGTPPTDRAANAVLTYFAGKLDSFGTQRIGLTSSNRRVVPLTRDYQYAKQTLLDYARPDTRRDGVAPFSAAVSYEDYSTKVDDLLALCLTGFPGFDQKAAQRRSLIYVGPDLPNDPTDVGPALFAADRVRQLATAGGVQVNAIVTGRDSDALAALARDTGGRSASADASVPVTLNDIRDHPPAARFTADGSDVGAAPESPDVPAVIALAAAVALAGWPMVQRR